MAHAVSLLLDQAAADGVRKMWQRLADAAVTRSMLDLGVDPHVTLAVFEHAEDAPASQCLKAFATGTAPVPVRFDSLGLFPDQGVLFLAPKVSPELLAIQARLHRELAPFTAGGAEHFAPTRWVPHCTLGMSLDSGAMIRAVSEMARTWWHISGRLSSVELVRFPPAERIFRQDLA